MAKLLKFPWGLSLLSGVVATVAGAAIVFLDAPAATLIFAGWATVIAYEPLSSWVDRRLGRR
jgi:uncharacterized membrane protein